MELPKHRAFGLMLIPDAHVAASPPMQRLPGYCAQIMAKIRAALERAQALELVPVFLGDLFHWPRENPNSLIVELIELLRPHKPYILVGNHDKYQARFTPDVSLAVLAAAKAATVISEPGPVFCLETPQGAALIGASPDAAPLPRAFEAGQAQVVWLTHHNLSLPDFPDKQHKLREIPGVDWVINGHIHRPQPTQTLGATRWANPGNITRLTFTRRTLERVPASSIWRPGAADLERYVLPHLPFYEVFPDQEFPIEEPKLEGKSQFLRGLERLAYRRTQEGLGLRGFLSANLNPGNPETELIWDLYKEVTRAEPPAA